MPASHTARRDDIEVALRTLHGERVRLERLGFERPLARCHAEIRYWSFLSALYALPAHLDPVPGRGGY